MLEQIINILGNRLQVLSFEEYGFMYIKNVYYFA